MGYKRKKTENSMIGHKKRKDKKSTGTVGLTNNDYTLLMEPMGEIASQILKKMDECQTELIGNIIDLQMLCKAVK